MPQVVITPYLGGATVETRRRMAELSVENLMAGLRGEPLPHPVGGGSAPPRSAGGSAR
jgi:glyoxylate reductase